MVEKRTRKTRNVRKGKIKTISNHQGKMRQQEKVEQEKQTKQEHTINKDEINNSYNNKKNWDNRKEKKSYNKQQWWIEGNHRLVRNMSSLRKISTHTNSV